MSPPSFPEMRTLLVAVMDRIEVMRILDALEAMLAAVVERDLGRRARQSPRTVSDTSVSPGSALSQIRAATLTAPPDTMSPARIMSPAWTPIRSASSSAAALRCAPAANSSAPRADENSARRPSPSRMPGTASPPHASTRVRSCASSRSAIDRYAASPTRSLRSVEPTRSVKRMTAVAVAGADRGGTATCPSSSRSTLAAVASGAMPSAVARSATPRACSVAAATSPAAESARARSSRARAPSASAPMACATPIASDRWVRASSSRPAAMRGEPTSSRHQEEQSVGEQHPARRDLVQRVFEGRFGDGPGTCCRKGRERGGHRSLRRRGSATG